MVDIQFGQLRVISLNKIHNRQKIWNCTCSCGVEITRSTGQLNRGAKNKTNQSCRKCAQRANKSKDLGLSSWRMLFNSYIAGAKRRSLEFNLSFEVFRSICSLKCHYCEAEPSRHNRYVREDGKLISKISKFTADRSWISWNGIDRKSNTVGYTIENCLPCCTSCNVMKGTLDYHDFITRCGIIYSVRKTT